MALITVSSSPCPDHLASCPPALTPPLSQALSCGQAHERKAPSGHHPGTGTAVQDDAAPIRDTTTATAAHAPTTTAQAATETSTASTTTTNPTQSSLLASSPPAAPSPFLRESSPAALTLPARPSPTVTPHARSPLATLSATHASSSSSHPRPHHYSRLTRRSGGYCPHPAANTTGTCTTAYARAPAPRLAPCVVCLEDEAPCLLLLPCRHRLCAGCARGVVRRVVAAPLPCPVCRETVEQVASPEG